MEYFKNCVFFVPKLSNKNLENLICLYINIGSGVFLREFLPLCTHVVCNQINSTEKLKYFEYGNFIKLVNYEWLELCF